MLSASFVCTHPPPPIPPFLLKQNISPEVIAGSDVPRWKFHAGYIQLPPGRFKLCCLSCIHEKHDLSLQSLTEDGSAMQPAESSPHSQAPLLAHVSASLTWCSLPGTFTCLLFMGGSTSLNLSLSAATLLRLSALWVSLHYSLLVFLRIITSCPYCLSITTTLWYFLKMLFV